MGCGEDRPRQQPAVDVGFVFPDVEDIGTAAAEQRGAVDHLAARRVDDHGLRFQLTEEGFVGHAARRGIERRVERDEVAVPRHLLQRDEVAAAFACGTRRIAGQHAESPRCGVPAYQLPDVSRADHSQRLFGRMPPVALREVMQYGCDPLQYAAGVAACGRCYADLPAPAVVEVDMVESDGRRGDEPHPRTVEQRRVAARAGADDQRVGVAHVARRYLPARKIAYLGVGFEDPFEKRDGVIDDDFHFSPCIIGTKVGKFERFRIFDSALDTLSRHNQAGACFCARLFVSLRRYVANTLPVRGACGCPVAVRWYLRMRYDDLI